MLSTEALLVSNHNAEAPLIISDARDWVCPPKAELAERQDPVARDIGDGRCACALRGQANQAELDGFAAAKVSSAMRLAVIAATRAGGWTCTTMPYNSGSTTRWVARRVT